MNRSLNKVAMLAATLMLLAPAASAQTTSNQSLDYRIDDINLNAQRELDRANDAQRFGAAEFPPGWTGSFSASYNGTSGNTDTQEASIGGRFFYGAGLWSHTVGLALEFGEEDGNQTKEETFVIYDANRALSGNLYVFGLGRLQTDKFAALETDVFLGAGPGYRIVNSENVAWRVQAGPGVRYTNTNRGNEATEVAAIASSRFFYRITDAVFLTNDTDVLYSDIGTLVTNDFGVSYAMTDMLAARLGYRTEYNSDPTGRAENSDNTVGLSLVYSFN